MEEYDEDDDGDEFANKNFTVSETIRPLILLLFSCSINLPLYHSQYGE
jgi:hypothetical protein